MCANPTISADFHILKLINSVPDGNEYGVAQRWNAWSRRSSKYYKRKQGRAWPIIWYWSRSNVEYHTYLGKQGPCSRPYMRERSKWKWLNINLSSNQSSQSTASVHAARAMVEHNHNKLKWQEPWAKTNSSRITSAVWCPRVSIRKRAWQARESLIKPA